MHIFKKIVFFLRLTLTVSAINHFVLKDNVISPKPETPFLLREPHNLAVFLDQIRNSEFVESNFLQLLRQREQIVEQLQFSVQYGKELIDQARCAMEYYVTEKRTSYLKFSSAYMQRLAFEEFRITKDNMAKQVSEPNCEDFMDYTNGCFDNLSSLKKESVNSITIEAEKEMSMGERKMGLDALKRQAIEMLLNSPKSWKSYLFASFYWRYRGEGKKALECARRSFVLAPENKKDMPLLSLGVILFRSGKTDDADIILTTATEMAPKVSENHFALAAALAVRHAFSRSLNHFDEAERLDPSLLPKTLPLRKFIACFDNLTKKTTKMNSYVQYIKKQVRDFKNLKQQIMKRQEMIVQQQVPLGARHFNEFTNNDELLKRGQYCSMRVLSASDEPVLFCDFFSDMQMRLESKDVDITALERDLKATSEAVIKQVTKELGKEITFDEINSPKAQTPETSKHIDKIT